VRTAAEARVAASKIVAKGAEGVAELEALSRGQGEMDKILLKNNLCRHCWSCFCCGCYLFRQGV